MHLVLLSLLTQGALAEPSPVRHRTSMRVPVEDDSPYGFDVRRKGRLGLGLVIGPRIDGLSAKVFLSETQALQFTAGYAPGTYRYFPDGGFGASASWLFHFPRMFDDVVTLAWNVGAGISGRMAYFDSQFQVRPGVHANIGLEVLFEDLPIDIVAEYAPGILVDVSSIGELSFAYGEINLHLRVWMRLPRNKKRKSL